MGAVCKRHSEEDTVWGKQDVGHSVGVQLGAPRVRAKGGGHSVGRHKVGLEGGAHRVGDIMWDTQCGGCRRGTQIRG